ncbi:hypothetical protein [Helicobacter sp. 11S02629-2]|uniref:hypothetical protein n=1 Tax=Helicobacter sp. 11S02629-2 TaxID=1476195 RepID=UPI000BA5D0F6|nr:hypothetical protein [Helicobacter sp. 11S02629-2]PAF43106.1 hypothetical protein BKH40_07260 [Helicobacter sp. 11S02629-2]
MRISEVLNTTYGKLLNTPFISAFTSLACSLEQVKTGSLFFANDKDDIAKAIEKGAYGIVFCGTCKIIEEEIAWIEVDSISSAIKLLIRYILSMQKLKVVLLKDLELDIAKDLSLQAYIFEGSSKEKFIEYIYNEPKKEQFLLTKDASLKDILPNILESKSVLESKSQSFQSLPSKNLLSLLRHTLFESTLLYKGRVFNLPLPYILVPYLESLLHLCEKEGISYSLENYKKNSSINFLYLDSNNHLSDKETSKVLIQTSKPEVFLTYASYLEKKASYLKLICLSLDSKTPSLESNTHQKILCASEAKLISTIKDTDFNLCLLEGVRLSFLQQSFAKDTTSKGLFDLT